VTAEGKTHHGEQERACRIFLGGARIGSRILRRRHAITISSCIPLPMAIHGSTYYYSMDDVAAVGGWLGENAAKISPRRRTQPLPARSSRESQGKTAAQGGKVAMVTGAAFADSRRRPRPC